MVPHGKVTSEAEERSAREAQKGDSAIFALLVTIMGAREQVDNFTRVGDEKVLPQLTRLGGFKGSLVLANAGAAR